MLTTEIAFDPRLRVRSRNDVAVENDVETRPEKGIPVKTCRDVKAFVDRAKMSQVIHNLVSNGLKFTPSGGHVSVTVTVEEEPPFPRENVYTSTLLPVRVKNESASGSPIVAGPVFVKITVKDTGAGLSQVKSFKAYYLITIFSWWWISIDANHEYILAAKASQTCLYYHGDVKLNFVVEF